MAVERLTCNSCGAPLEVPSSANYVTCNHCSTQLTIRRQENVTFTESLERLAERTDQLTEQVENLSGQNESQRWIVNGSWNAKTTWSAARMVSVAFRRVEKLSAVES